MRKFRIAATAVALSAGLALPAQADWREDLAAQMRWDHDCQVTIYTGTIERNVNGNLVVITKVHCDDGRVFDAIQRDELADFEVDECTPVEQAC